MTEQTKVELSEKSFRGLVVGAVVVAAIVAYANTAGNEFVWDDVSSVLLHKHVQDPSKFFQLFREDQHAFGRGQGNFYRPLVAASFMVDFALSYLLFREEPEETRIPEVSPFLFHVTNVCWHAAAALLLFALMTRLGAPRFVRAVAPLVYVVHPLHTEAVTYISGRADPMSAVFMFLGLWFALCEGTTAKRIAGTALAALCFCAGLLSKESSGIFPFLLLLVLLLRPAGEGEKKPGYLVRFAPFIASLVILGIYALLRSTVLRFGAGATPDIPLGRRLVETGQALASYFRLLIIPTGLHMERTLAGTPRWTALVGWALLAGCLALIVWSFRHRRYRVCLGLGWFVLTWFPISGLFPLNAPMAEHWLYVPMAGLLWAVAELVWPLVEKRKAVGPAVAATYLLCVLLIIATVDRNRDWHDNESIYRTTLADNPRSMRIHYNLGVTYEDLLGNLPGARRHYEAVITLCSDQRKAAGKTMGGGVLWDQELEAHLSLGKIFFQQKQYSKAADNFRAVLRVKSDEAHKPLIATAAFGLGKCYLAFGDTSRAIELFKQAIVVRPDLRNEAARALTQGLLGASAG